nr:hypothetical protein [Mucilaginibacter sp. L294]
MKKSVILSAILFGSLVYNSAQAQISVHIGFNIPARRVYVPAPPPQPVEVYDNDEFDNSDDYYYLPEVEAYYSVPRHCYYYQDGGRWISAAYLPGAYRNYDWRTARRFEIRGSRPYMRHDEYRNKWGGGFNRDWNRRSDNYAGRRLDNNHNDWNRNNNRNDRPQGGFNQPNRNNDNHGSWGQPAQPNRNNDNRDGRDRNKGGFGQPNRNDNNGGGSRDRGNQPSQPGRNDNNGGGRDRGNQRGGNTQFAQNQIGRGDSHRPGRL